MTYWGFSYLNFESSLALLSENKLFLKQCWLSSCAFPDEYPDFKTCLLLISALFPSEMHRCVLGEAAQGQAECGCFVQCSGLATGLIFYGHSVGLAELLQQH